LWSELLKEKGGQCGLGENGGKRGERGTLKEHPNERAVGAFQDQAVAVIQKDQKPQNLSLRKKGGVPTSAS